MSYYINSLNGMINNYLRDSNSGWSNWSEASSCGTLFKLKIENQNIEKGLYIFKINENIDVTFNEVKKVLDLYIDHENKNNEHKKYVVSRVDGGIVFEVEYMDVIDQVSTHDGCVFLKRTNDVLFCGSSEKYIIKLVSF